MKPRTTAGISLSPDGFTNSSGATIAWAEVSEIIASKEDCLTTDEICLGFRRGDREEYVCVNVPGVRTDWFSEVAFPAFAVNRTMLCSRPG
jgi:hypothetical protein